MNFLVMEDYFPLRSELEDLIEALGHTAFGANNATEASQVIENTPIDAVIADIFVMQDDKFTPDGGVLLLSRIRTAFNQKNIQASAPVLVITGGLEIQGGFSPRELAKNLGASATMAKPLDMDAVATWIVETAKKLQGMADAPQTSA